MSDNIDALLLRDPILHDAWNDVLVKIKIVCDSDAFPLRQKYYHMPHGYSHWNTVRINAENLWEGISIKHANWQTPESAFLVRTASFLHDIAMILGSEYVPLTKQSKSRFDSMGAKTDNLDDRLAESPLGQYLIRKYQDKVSSMIVRAWAKNGPFTRIPNTSIERLAFLLENYAARDLTKYEAIAAALDRGHSERLLAIAAAMQIADWADLSSSRISTEMLKVRISELIKVSETDPSGLEGYLQNDQDVDCGDLFSLPILFRSYYVLSDGLNTEDPFQPSLQVRLALPPFFENKTTDDAFLQLTSEWRAKLSPSKMHGPTADDHFLKYGGIRFIFEEPKVENIPTLDLIETPPFVRDFWIASRWFDLGLSRQLIEADLGRRSPDYEFNTLQVENGILYKNFHDEKGLCPATKPWLSRRIFLFLHSKLSGGHPRLAARFFQQFQHDLCCAYKKHSKGRKELLKNCVFHSVVETKTALKEEWNIPPLSENEWKVVSALSSLIWITHGHAYRSRILRDIVEQEIKSKWHLRLNIIKNVLNTLEKYKAINIIENEISIAPFSSEGAYVAFLGSPFHIDFCQDMDHECGVAV
jgi:hypothetical protein